MATRFKDLICWRKALDLASAVYSATQNLNDFGLRDQLRRASISAMNNIAEGFGRMNPNDARRFFEYSSSSCLEIESMTYLIERKGILDAQVNEDIRQKAIETYKVTRGFSKSLMSKKSN